MTSNQISYWANKERERSNKAVEKETKRSNIARETETNRHNVVVEVETERHNRATELLTKQQIEEQARHNLATEAQTDRQLQENERANLAREAIQTAQITLGYANLGLGYNQLSEQVRHNQAGEKATLIDLNYKRDYNLGLLQQSEKNYLETVRSNKAKEEQNRLQWIQGYAQLGETQTHNRATEAEAVKSRKQRAAEAFLNFGAQMTRNGVQLAGSVYGGR